MSFGKRIHIPRHSHTVKSFLFGQRSLRFGNGLAQVVEFLGGDVLLFVNLPNLIFALVGDARVFGFLHLHSKFFKLRGKPC